MSEQLSIIELKETNRQMHELNKKQFSSIAELCSLLVDITNKLDEVDDDSDKAEFLDCIDSIHELINLRTKRATNYLHLPQR